jgi:hypothetical protein
VAAAVEAFTLVVQRERQAFGERSYFYHQDRLKHFGIAFPEVEPDEESEVEGQGPWEGGKGSADFAEAAISEVE